ncbi:PREDICTED: actin-binding protein anillin [Nanorana parkeri]|uniref:actin-binding protein anillin n=1 Tax=Nanorana parkeri TaxID=125878 RepID=UPI00085498DE|nr:PREDICTED: actin-binding protein anillin [Nanorana parkeri]
MDPFTEKLLERTRARRENLQKKMADRPTAGSRTAVLNKRPLIETNRQPPVQAEEEKPCAKPSPSKKRCSDENKILGTENKQPKSPVIVKSTQPEIVAHPQVKPTVQTPPRTTVTTKEELNSPDHEASSIRTRMQRLADQRRYWDNNGSPSNSPPIANPPKEIVPSPPKAQASVINSETPRGRRTRLANLAATIGSWEDDLSYPSVKPNNTQEKPGTACLSKVASASAASSSINSHTVRQEAASQKPKEESVIKATLPSTLVSTRSESKLSSSTVANTIIDASKPIADKITNVVPSKLKEKNEPSVQIEKSLSANVSTPQRVERPTSKIFTNYQATPREENSRATPVAQKEKTATGGPGVKSFLERFGEKCQDRSPAPVNTGPKSSLLTPTTKSIHERLLKQNDVSSTASLTQQQKKEREKELAAIRSRFEKGSVWTADKEDPAKTKHQETQREIQAHPVTSSKPPKPNVISNPVSERVPASPQKGIASGSQQKMAGRVKSPEKSMQPSSVSLEKQEPNNEVKSGGDKVEMIQEIQMNVDRSINEPNSSEVINSIFSDNLENEEEEAVGDASTQQVERVGDDIESNKDRDDRSDDEDDDALNISSMSLLTPLAETVGVGSPEALLSLSLSPSNVDAETSASCDSPKSVKFQRTRVPRAESKDSFKSIEENQNLLYSIDAYRSQRFKESDRPPVVQTIVRKEDVSSRMEDVTYASPRHVNIKQKLKILNNEIILQQTVIHQASQALNCCTDEEHGKGTQTEAEAERLLLFATEKRVCLLAEINKLKSESAQKRPQPYDNTPSRGLISLSEIFLPIKPDFICSTSQRPDAANYYFFIIIRAGAEKMLATPLASISSSMKGDALTFPTTFTMEDVSNDFAICLDVYSLAQKKEGPALDKRKKAVKTKAITPKRLLTSITKSNMHTPVLTSPGGPNAVRTSNFVLVGSHKLSLSSIGNNKFLLDKVPFLSPLEGHICLKLKCQINSFLEEKGFLTMFEDVSGFGAWHRRWCVLSGYCISYWTYPDDEKRKHPMGRINLANCTSRKIEPANREFCARPNTLELITVRPQREGDRETLVSQCRDTLCVTKNWLSADTKDERNLWMQKLNQVLVDLRMWQPDACYRPATKV